VKIPNVLKFENDIEVIWKVGMLNATFRSWSVF
jgi:hypothetical protein